MLIPSQSPLSPSPSDQQNFSELGRVGKQKAENMSLADKVNSMACVTDLRKNQPDDVKARAESALTFEGFVKNYPATKTTRKLAMLFGTHSKHIFDEVPLDFQKIKGLIKNENTASKDINGIDLDPELLLRPSSSPYSNTMHNVITSKQLPQEQKEELIELLVDKGANINIPNKNGETPFFLAIKHKLSDIILHKFLEKGVDGITRPGPVVGLPPLFATVFSDRRMAILDLVISESAKNGIDAINIADPQTGTTIAMLVEYCSALDGTDDTFSKEMEQYSLLLKQKGAQGYTKEQLLSVLNRGICTLFTSNRALTISLSQVLRDENIDVKLVKDLIESATPFDLFLPLMGVWENSSILHEVFISNIPIKEMAELVNLLLEKGADVNAVNNVHRESVFEFALRANLSYQILDNFIDRGIIGINKPLIDNGIPPPLFKILKLMGSNLQEMLTASRENNTEEFKIAQELYLNNVEKMKYLIEKGADVNAISPITGLTPLMSSAEYYSDAIRLAHGTLGFEIVTILLERGADPNIESDPNMGYRKRKAKALDYFRDYHLESKLLYRLKQRDEVIIRETSDATHMPLDLNKLIVEYLSANLPKVEQSKVDPEIENP